MAKTKKKGSFHSHTQTHLYNLEKEKL